VGLTSGSVKVHAREAGFDLCGIARAQAYPRLSRLADWIARGFAGEMAYLARSLEERGDPARVLPSARSVVALACVYNTAAPYSATITDAGRAVIARYAWGDDYHDVLRARLRRLVRTMADAGHAPGAVPQGVRDLVLRHMAGEEHRAGVICALATVELWRRTLGQHRNHRITDRFVAQPVG